MRTPGVLVQQLVLWHLLTCAALLGVLGLVVAVQAVLRAASAVMAGLRLVRPRPAVEPVRMGSAT